MNLSEPPADAAGKALAAADAMPEGLAMPVHGPRRNSQRRQSLMGLKFLNDLLDEHDHDYDNDNVMFSSDRQQTDRPSILVLWQIQTLLRKDA